MNNQSQPMQTVEDSQNIEIDATLVHENKIPRLHLLAFITIAIIGIFISLFFYITYEPAVIKDTVQLDDVNQTSSPAENIELVETATTVISSNSEFTLKIPTGWTAYEYDNSHNIPKTQAIALNPANSVSSDPTFGVITVQYTKLDPAITLDQYIKSAACPEDQACDNSGEDTVVAGVKAKKIKNAGGPLPSDQVFLISENTGYRLLINYDISETFDPEVPGSDYKTETGKQNEKVFNQVIDSFKFL